MIRRFVNLVAQKPSSNNGAYSLHRLDVAKHLFYPSTAKAGAAATAKEQSNGGGGGGGDNKRPNQPGSGFDTLRRLPRPTVRFQQVPPTRTWRPLDDMFVLLNPGGGGGGGGAAGDRILHLHASKDGGHGDVYDADSGSVISTVPSPTLDGPNRLGVQPITFFSVAAGTTTDRGDGEEKQKQDYSRRRRLYVMTDNGGRSFQCLDLSEHPLKWQPLPPAPFAVARAAPAAPSSITSFTAVDGGSTIVVSTLAKGTYCFDTRTHEWRRAGDWVLPFDGRAHYVPELDAWLGFSRGGGDRVEDDNGHHHYQQHQLCASSDLAAAMADDAGRAPALQYVWDDLVLPRDHETMKTSRRFGEFEIERWSEWFPYGYFPHGGHRLINLGGGRFCVAKAFRLKHLRSFESDCPYSDPCSCEDPDPDDHEVFDTEDLVVLTGVEVVRGGGGGDGGGLRMVKHRSMRYNYKSTRDAEEIKWVL